MTTSSVVASGLDQLASLLGGVTADDLDLPTPCSDWTVRDLADHAVGSVAQLTTMARGEEVDWSAPTPHHDEPASAFRQNADALVAAIDAGDGSFPVAMAAGELAIHAWDLATALGRDTGDLDPQVAETGHAFMSQALTDERRGNAFASEKPAPPGANAYQRIAAFAGRDV